MKLLQIDEVGVSLRQLLENSVDPEVQTYWDLKVAGGIVPTEVKNQGEVDYAKHLQEMHRLASFEGAVVSRLFKNEWKPWASKHVGEVHYFGIGTGIGFKEVVPLANATGYRVTGYDISSVSCDVGIAGLELLPISVILNNEVLLADIEVACDRKHIPKVQNTLFILSRVLHVLDKEEKNWSRKKKENRKMARTARKIGKLLAFSEVLLVHPCPEDNPHAVWGDTTPHSIEEVVGYMQQGFRGRLEWVVLGKESFHNHVYTAFLIRCAERRN